MNPFDRFDAPQRGQNPFDRFDRSTAPDEPWRTLDYDQPIEALRHDIAKLPERDKHKALSVWADRAVAKEREAGFKQLPRVAEGIPLIGGLLDEATAGIQSGLHSISGGVLGEPYEEALALDRARSRQADDANPVLAATSKLTAGVVTGGPLFSRIPLASTTAGRIGQGAAIGAPLAMYEAYSRGEGGVDERLREARGAAVPGAVVGGVLPLLSAVGSRAYGYLSDRISPGITRMRHGPEQAADEILAIKMMQEGTTPGQKRLDLQQGQQTARLNSNSSATLPETLADTSDTMQRLTGSVYRTGGEAGNLVRTRLQQRQRGPDNPYGPQAAATTPDGQHARIVDTTERALLAKRAGTARQQERQIIQEQAAEGKRLYDLAYNNSDRFDLSPAMTAMAFRVQQYPRPFATQLQRAMDLFKRAGSARNQPFWVSDVRRFDGAKKALDDMIEKAQRGGRNNLARELVQFKDDLLAAVHGRNAQGQATLNRTYEQARGAWGSAAERREAIDLGRAALRQNSEVSVEQFRELTPGQQQLFRVGFLESLRNALGTTRPGSDTTLLLQQRRVQELMNEIIPRSRGSNATFADRPQRFGEIIRRENRMTQTNNAVLGNSATAQRSQDDAEFAGQALRSMWDRFRQSPSLFNMGVEAIGSGIQSIFGYRQDVAIALARRLLETDRTTQNQILRRLARRVNPDRFQRFAEMLDQTAIAIPATTAPAVLESGERAR